MIEDALRCGSSFALAALVIACSTTAPAPKIRPDPPRTTPVRSPSSATPAAEDAPAPPERVAYADAKGPGVLAKMPRGAALYAAVHLDLLESFRELGELERELIGQGRSLRRLFEAAGGDPRRALLVAVVPPTEASARSVIETFVKVGPGKAVDAQIKRNEVEGVSIRVLVPLGPGADPAQATRNLVQELTGRQVLVCEEIPQCKEAFKVEPLVYGFFRDRAVAGYPVEHAVLIDVAAPLFNPGKAPPLGALARLASLEGGPESPRCQVFDASAGAALCVDADRAGELGAAIGYAKTLGALEAAVGLKTTIMKRIAEEGLKEASQNMRLAAPARRLLDDGTLSIDSVGTGFEIRSSHAYTESSRVTLERAFAAGDSGESCAEGSEVLARLFPKLMDAFAEPGPDFTDAARTLRSIQEAGWGAWPVMYARTWPNVLVASRERLQELSLTALGSTCIRLKDGRLEIDTVTAAR